MIYVFTGPTLPLSVAKIELDAIYLPPAAQGDLYRAALNRPKAIGIIDGFFERVPAIWHKEILWAMEQGIHVFGSASMGALRAAELHAFGMVGIGRIFESYVDGSIEDDDEVALIHGPADSGYVAMSEPMVNIRRTLSEAVISKTISDGTRITLERIAKNLFYARRNYREILRAGGQAELPPDELEALNRWLMSHRFDQKREDALLMLRTMRERITDETEPKCVDFRTEYTEWWDTLQRQAGTMESRGGTQNFHTDMLLDEVRLDPNAYNRLRHQTVLRYLAGSEAIRRRWPVEDSLIEQTIVDFRKTNGITNDGSFENWLALNNIDHGKFKHAIHEHIAGETFANSLFVMLTKKVIESMILNNEYFQWTKRLIDKETYLKSKGLENPDIKNTGLARESLLDWYFRDLGIQAPDNVASYAISVGFKDEETFLHCITKEFIYTNR